MLALIAHDQKKDDLVGFVLSHREIFERMPLVATGSTGRMLEDKAGLDIECVAHGPDGGDLIIGGRVALGQIKAVIFFRDPLTSHGISDAFRDAELLAVALDAALAGAAEEAVALQGYETIRLAEMAEIFDLTCALAAYPPLTEFTEYNKRLCTAIDAEAAVLAARPAPAAASAGA